MSALKDLWLTRAATGFLLPGARCVVSGRTHRLVENEREDGMVRCCQDCKAGLAVNEKTRRALRSGRDLPDMDIREACWMCGSAFSAPRTRDEYEVQACAWCLFDSEDRKLTTLKDQKTRDVGRSRPVSAHIMT